MTKIVRKSNLAASRSDVRVESPKGFGGNATERSLNGNAMLDLKLYHRALQLSDEPRSPEEMVTLAMKTYIAIQAAHRLGELGGCAPDMEDIPRRRWDPEGAAE